MMVAESCDVAIIGAGPAGAVAAALLCRKGYEVVVLERQVFPRFAIGESLLPQCMVFLEEAGMIEAVTAAGFQLKDGAAFHRRGRDFSFDFSDKFTAGWSSTFQVPRARFDKLLADEAARTGASIHYAHEILDVDIGGARPVLSYRDPEGRQGRLEARFCLDASGFARRLAQLQALDSGPEFPIRDAVFTHVIDQTEPKRFDRNKILITVHPDHHHVWFWLIPFSNGTSSLGVVGAKEHFSGYTGDERAILRTNVEEAQMLGGALTRAEYHLPGQRISGYASTSCRLYGRFFALLGNAGGFLDPIFSSGVTIAMKSASLAADLLDRQFRGRVVDWETEFAQPLSRGVETFRHFVTAWYDGRLQDIIFAERTESRIYRMICSILAGYAWDEANLFVTRPGSRLTALAAVCRGRS
jgi:flavin-dependent dehydrogenase